MDEHNEPLNTDLLKDIESLYRTHLREELGEFAQAYPSQDTLTINWHTLYSWNESYAEDYLTHPTYMNRHLVAALEDYDYPIPIEPEDPTVYVVGLNNEDTYLPAEIPREDPDGYFGVSGDLAKVSQPVKELTTGVFVCQRCGHETTVPQDGDERQEPYQCESCERQGPFKLNREASEFVHYQKIRIETPPDETGELQSQHIDGYVRGSLVWRGHPEYGLLARSGDSATVYGRITREPRDKKSTKYEEYLDVHAIEFESDQDDIQVDAHKPEFMGLAEREDAIDLLSESLAPELYATPAWDTALELLVAYLFGSPRISIPKGATFRGDIHALIISDYGMGKSMVNEAVATYSPKAIKESATGLSSEVGLLAAAVEDDFGQGQWTLAPGILVRANGGHVILDEIDKTDADLSRMNDALEGEQLITVNKAGQNATYKSRVGLLATGNPEDSRFNPHDAISEQLDIDQSLLSRFDGIITMSDSPDEDMDSGIAETQGLSVLEAQEYEYGEREEFDQLGRPVSPEVGRAWIQYARENVHPMIQRHQVDMVTEWYAGEVRKLNEKFAANEGVGADMPVPANPRVVKAVYRFASAFARVHLRDTVQDGDVERAMSLAKSLVGQQFDGEKFNPHESRQTTRTTQEDLVEDVKDTIESLSDGQGGVAKDAVVESVSRYGVDESRVRRVLGNLYDNGVVMEPKHDHVRLT